MVATKTPGACVAARRFIAAACGAIAVAAAAAEPAFLIAATKPIGGFLQAKGTDVVLDALGNAYVSGIIQTTGLPGVDSARITNAGIGQRFVARIDKLASTPAFVAVVGASSAESGWMTSFVRDGATGLIGDPAGNTYLVAYDSGLAYPLTGGPFRRLPAKKYVYRVSSTGEVVRLSAALDPAIRRVGAIARDAGGNLYLTGSAADGLVTSAGASFPTASVAARCIAPFVAKLDATGQTVLYATYLGVSGVGGHRCGGAGILGNFDPSGFALAVDDTGSAFVTGQAEPGLVATPGAVNAAPTQNIPHLLEGGSFQSASHAFVARLAPSGALTWAARLGGEDHDRGTSIALDAGGGVYVAGKTASKQFPREGGVGSIPSAVPDCLNATPEFGFVAKFPADGTRVLYSGYVPAMGDTLDRCTATGDLAPLRVLPDAYGNAVVAGLTSPSMRSFGSSWNGMEPIPSSASFVMVFNANGVGTRYASTFAGYGVEGIARDDWGNLVTVDNAAVVRTLSPNFAPVELDLSAEGICAGQSVVLDARVAASYDAGSVDFLVDGASVGTVPVVAGAARLTTTLAVGVRRLRAVYAGTGHFAGYRSIHRFVAVEQAGVCQ